MKLNIKEVVLNWLAELNLKDESILNKIENDDIMRLVMRIEDYEYLLNNFDTLVKKEDIKNVES